MVKTWLEEIVGALTILGGKASYVDLYKQIENTTTRELTPEWKATVRREVENHSTDSNNYTGGEDVFYSVKGIGRGNWGLRSFHPDRLRAFDTDLDNALEESRQTAKETVQITRIVRDSVKARRLKELYENKCQICGNTLDMGSRDYSEAHHLQPLGGHHKGPDISANMIVLCPNHHALFDYGAIAIDPDTLEMIDRNGVRRGRVRLESSHGLNMKYLKYHMERIFESADSK